MHPPFRRKGKPVSFQPLAMNLIHEGVLLNEPPPPPPYVRVQARVYNCNPIKSIIQFSWNKLLLSSFYSSLML